MFKFGSGRKTDDGVWKYFKYESASNHCVCTVRLSDNTTDGPDATCGVIIKGKNATNLKNHIRFKHKSMIPEIEHNNKEVKNKKLDAITSIKVRSCHCHQEIIFYFHVNNLTVNTEVYCTKLL